MTPNPANLIAQLRALTDFDLDAMNSFLEGSVEDAKETQELMRQVERDPFLKVDSKYYESSKEEHRLITAKKIARLAMYVELDLPNYEVFQKRLNIVQLCDPQTATRVGVHIGLFLGAIRGNGTDEQFKYWCFERGTIHIKDIYGCFAMTELAHGSNVAGLETTAIYDDSAKEFVINTPHIGATKWWIGGAAHSANHAVVYARLIVNGEDYGVKTFVVPLRDKNHDILPGVTLGDIGAKMGRDGIDNGWIQFSNVRIPKLFMLTKYTRIEEDGEVVVPPLEQLSYGALLNGRVTMVNDSFRMGERFITIALRYAVGRRQFGDSKGEKQLISYPLHQSRLIPWLAYVYAALCGTNRLSKEYFRTIVQLEKAAKSQDLRSIGVAIEALKNVFCSSASLKSTCTWYTATLIDECRQSCGGHGYSSYAGFGKLYTDWVVQCTWEGDNNVLAMNAGRMVIQGLQKLQKGKTIKGDLQFLNEYKKYLDFKDHHINDLDSLLNILKLGVIKLANHIVGLLAQNGNNWDIVGQEKVLLSKLNAAYYLMESLVNKVAEFSDSGNIKPSIELLAKVFALSQIEKYNGCFLQFNILDSELSAKVSEELKKLYLVLLDKVIGLTDAFKLSDFFINSPLGSYNGDIYSNYFGIVKLMNNPSDDKLPYTDEFLKLLNREEVEVRNKDERSELVLAKLSKSKL